MLWEYTLLLFVFSFLGLLLAFDRNIDPVGQIFFMFLAGVLLPSAALGLLKIDYNWGGSQNVVQYTYIPTNGEEYITYTLATIGALLIIIASWKAVLLMLPKAKAPTTTTYLNYDKQY